MNILLFCVVYTCYTCTCSIYKRHQKVKDIYILNYFCVVYILWSLTTMLTAYIGFMLEVLNSVHCVWVLISMACNALKLTWVLLHCCCRKTRRYLAGTSPSGLCMTCSQCIPHWQPEGTWRKNISTLAAELNRTSVDGIFNVWHELTMYDTQFRLGVWSSCVKYAKPTTLPVLNFEYTHS